MFSKNNREGTSMREGGDLFLGMNKTIKDGGVAPQNWCKTCSIGTDRRIRKWERFEHWKSKDQGKWLDQIVRKDGRTFTVFNVGLRRSSRAFSIHIPCNFKHVGYFGLSLTFLCSFGPAHHFRTMSDNRDHLRPAWNCLGLFGTLESAHFSWFQLDSAGFSWVQLSSAHFSSVQVK